MLRLLFISLFAFCIILLNNSCDSECIENEKVEAKFILDGATTDTSVEVEVKNSDFEENILSVEENDQIVAELVKVEKWENKDIVTQRTSWGPSGGTTNWTANDKVGIFMRNASGGSSYFDLNNIQYNVTSATQSSAATPVSSTIYFPNPNSQNVIFYGYYPYNSNSNSTTINYTIPTDQTAVSALASGDLMSATSASVNSTSPNVSLNFQHRLVLLTFQIKAGVLGGLLSNVTINGTAITNTGTLNLLNNTLTTNPSPTFSPKVDTNINLGIGQTTIINMIINPCSFTNNTGIGSHLYVTMSYAGLSLRRTNLTEVAAFQGGYRYIYNRHYIE